jgi:hypothetical protein
LRAQVDDHFGGRLGELVRVVERVGLQELAGFRLGRATDRLFVAVAALNAEFVAA